MRTFKPPHCAGGDLEFSRVAIECGERGPREQPVMCAGHQTLRQKARLSLISSGQSPDMESGPTGRTKGLKTWSSCSELFCAVPVLREDIPQQL